MLRAISLKSPHMHPPYYVLCSRSTPTTTAPNAALIHPAIQYHYKDDPSLALVPHPAEQVLILDYDPDTNAPPTVQSISPSISVTGLRVEEAPGAAAAATDEGVARNDRMFIIETTTAQDRFVYCNASRVYSPRLGPWTARWANGSRHTPSWRNSNNGPYSSIRIAEN